MNTKHISLRIIWNDIRFVHKMYGRGKGFDIPCVMGNYLFFDRRLTGFAVLDGDEGSGVNLIQKFHIGG